MRRKNTSLGISVCLSSLICLSSAFGGPGDGISVDEWELVPYLELSAKYDSNVFLEDRGEDSDFSLIGEYGLNAGRETETIELSLLVWGKNERYSDFSDQDHDDWGDEVSVALTSPGKMVLSLSQEYTEIQDVDPQSSSFQVYDLQTYTVGIAKDQITDKLGAEVAFSYREKDYESESLFGYTRQTLSADVHHDISEKSRIFVEGFVGELDGDGNADKGDYYEVLTGLRASQSDKVTGGVGVGLIGLSSEEANISTFSFEANFGWKATEKVMLLIDADREIEPATHDPDNYEEITQLKSTVLYGATDAILFTAAASYRVYELENEIDRGDGLVNREEEILTWSFRVDYDAPADWLALFLHARFSNRDSTLDTLDYDRNTVVAGVHLQY